MPRLLSITLATTGTLAICLPASAATGDNLPPGANPTIWSRYVQNYSQSPDWSPQGSVVADTGFRAFPDGFSFFNTGVPDSSNNALFGTPLSGPANLDAVQMRDLMGKRVCVERSATGTCTLTPAAKLWMDSANESMAGGHCFGFATTAAELFNRNLRPDQFQPGVTRTYDLALAEPVEREIARNMAAQYMMDIGKRYIMRPKAVVEMLKTSLTAASTPFTLVMFWPGGGHAITPYALYDRGEGQYDVAVYDNNYPDAARAVRIDTQADTFQYLVGTNPNAAPTIASQSIGLVPVSEIAKKQDCPFCSNAKDTTVTLSPVKSRVRLKTKVVGMNGKRIPGVKVRKPTNPWSPGDKWEFPTYVVPGGKRFVIVVDATKRTKPVALNVNASTGAFVIGTDNAVIPARSAAGVGLIPRKGLVVYTATGAGAGARLGRLAFADTMPGSSVIVAARAGSKDSPYLVGRIRHKQAQVVVFNPQGRKSQARATAALSFPNEDGQAVQVLAQLQTKLPAKARLVVDYAKWSPKKPKGVRAYVIQSGERTRVPVKLAASG